MIQARSVNLLPGMSLGQVINPIIDNNFVNYVKENFNNNYQMLQQMGSSLVNNIQSLFNHFTSDIYINQAKNVAMDVGIQNDTTIYSVDCNSIYNAGMVMAGYIMANPILYDMYSKYRIDGYEDMFIQQDLSTNPYERLEYMQVTDGMVRFNEDGYEVSFYSHSGEDLTLKEKMTVLDAWDCAEFLLDNGIDPTNRNREEL